VICVVLFDCRELIRGQKTAIHDRRIYRKEDERKKAFQDAKERSERKAFLKEWRAAQRKIADSKITL